MNKINLDSSTSKCFYDEQSVNASTLDTESRNAIASRFSAAATHYQDFDVLQRMSARRLLKHFCPRGRVLDIGAGPGTVFNQSSCPHLCTHVSPALQVVALDIAQGMLQHLQTQFPDYRAVAGDAQQLPFQDASFHSLYSNVALQWCHDFSRAVSEAGRVLKNGGEFHLAVVAKGSLAELCELGFAVNAFNDEKVLSGSFHPESWDILSSQCEPLTVYFDDLKSLLYSIKGVGASIQTPKIVSTHGAMNNQDAAPMPSLTLRGRKDWQALMERADTMRTQKGLPLTYQIMFIRARKKQVLGS